jgi:hypothetical protein
MRRQTLEETTTPRPASRASHRPSPRDPRQLSPLPGPRDPARRAAQAPTLAVRAGLGAGRTDRRRAATRRLSALLPNDPTNFTAPIRKVRCRKRERRGSITRMSPRRSRYGSRPSRVHRGAGSGHYSATGLAPCGFSLSAIAYRVEETCPVGRELVWLQEILTEDRGNLPIWAARIAAGSDRRSQWVR